MINFSTNSSTFNPLVNLKVSVKNSDSKGTNSSILNSTTNSSKNTNSTQNNNSNSNEVLGYKVDKDGFFTAEFNKKAGIPQDYKIHSSTMQSLVKVTTSGLSRSFDSIDIAKSVGNAYKILSQVVGESVLSSKDSFTKDEIKGFPQGYEVDTRTFKVSNIYNTNAEFMGAARAYNNKTSGSKMLSGLFFNFSNPSANSADIFATSSVFGWANGDKYTNADGSITKSGLLISIMRENYFTIEGDTTQFGKYSGYDKNLSEAQRQQLAPNGIFRSDVLSKMQVDEASFAPSFWGADDEFSYKDPTQMILEEIIKMQKELAQKALKKRLDTAQQKVDIKA